jgi:hypothetical protein
MYAARGNFRGMLCGGADGTELNAIELWYSGAVFAEAYRERAQELVRAGGTRGPISMTQTGR